MPLQHTPALQQRSTYVRKIETTKRLLSSLGNEKNHILIIELKIMKVDRYFYFENILLYTRTLTNKTS